jgi:hypothetical protein
MIGDRRFAVESELNLLFQGGREGFFMPCSRLATP